MRYKILIVDDEASNLRTLERLFRHEHDVLTAESAAEAMALIHQHEIALLISDQRMPEISGIELMARTVKLRPHMVRILLTGYTEVNSLIEAINSGCVYKYLTKPWENENLVITVARALEHYETLKSRHNLQMMNGRLKARLNEISELAAINEEPVLQTRPAAGNEKPEFISSN